MAGARWFIARNKERVGPFSAADMQQLARFGLLKADEHVWVEGATRWVLAREVPGLFRPAGAKKYWLALSGRTQGPYVAEQVKAGLNALQFTIEVPACTDEDRTWRPLNQLVEFKDFKLDTDPLTSSQARMLTGSLEFEEAALHMAGKAGDDLARLISIFMDIRRSCTKNPALLESIDATITALRAKREAAVAEAS